MNKLTLALLIWASLATLVILFNYGAAVQNGGRKSRRDAHLAKAWQDRMFSKNS